MGHAKQKKMRVLPSLSVQVRFNTEVPFTLLERDCSTFQVSKASVNTG